MQRSIRDLCYEDQRGRAEVIGAWCAQKTPSALATALAVPNLYCLVAVDQAGLVAGVGLLGSGALIQAVHVDPSVDKPLEALPQQEMPRSICRRA